MKNKLLQILFWSWFLLIILFSIMPGSQYQPRSDNLFFRLDYLEHFVVFLILGGLGAAIFTAKMNYLQIAALLIMALIPEFLQVMVPQRTFNPWDCFFNLLGFGAGFCLIKFTYINKKRINER